jgi:hypothetical protein
MRMTSPRRCAPPAAKQVRQINERIALVLDELLKAQDEAMRLENFLTGGQ